MRNFTLLLCILAASAAKAQSETRLYVNMGGGPTYSLFYRSGGWVRDWGTANTNNITEGRDVWGFSHFGELEWHFKNPKWSIRGGYSMHYFSPKLTKNGVTGNGTYYFFNTNETDRYVYYQASLHYALVKGKNQLEAGTGFYIQRNKRQQTNYYEAISTPQTQGPATAFFLDNYVSEEAGFPVIVDYVRFLKNGNGIGCRFNFNYTQSVQTAEHLALQVFFKAKLK